MSLTALIRRMTEGEQRLTWVDANGQVVTAHGFRATFRMWTAEETTFPREVAEHALAHQLPDALSVRTSENVVRQASGADAGLGCLLHVISSDEA